MYLIITAQRLSSYKELHRFRFCRVCRQRTCLSTPEFSKLVKIQQLSIVITNQHVRCAEHDTVLANLSVRLRHTLVLLSTWMHTSYGFPSLCLMLVLVEMIAFLSNF